jgi:hypothetical protein
MRPRGGATTETIRGELRLWHAVLVDAINAVVAGSKAQARTAVDWIMMPGPVRATLFDFICAALGYNTNRLRASLPCTYAGRFARPAGRSALRTAGGARAKEGACCP